MFAVKSSLIGIKALCLLIQGEPGVINCQADCLALYHLNEVNYSLSEQQDVEQCRSARSAPSFVSTRAIVSQVDGLPEDVPLLELARQIV
jgi:hypothetical protein